MTANGRVIGDHRVTNEDGQIETYRNSEFWISYWRWSKWATSSFVIRSERQRIRVNECVRDKG